MSDDAKVQQAISMVNDTFVKEFELSAAQVVPEARLREDLGLDSLDAVDLLVALEKSLNTRIPEETARSMKTVGDIHAFIRTVAAQA